jgi:hypothetical protein
MERFTTVNNRDTSLDEIRLRDSRVSLKLSLHFAEADVR